MCCRVIHKFIYGKGFLISMKRVIFIVVFVLLSTFVIAHQPRYVGDAKGTIIVNEPSVSKAYYGRLSGEPHYYKIEVMEKSPMYLNVLIPGKELTHTVSAELIKDNEIIYVLDGDNFTWQPFFEEYGRDYYMMGPELDIEFTEGTYLVQVFNENNLGKYVLAVGKEESFPFWEILKAVVLVPYLKIFFFEKYYLIIVPVIIIASLMIWYLKKRK